MAEKEDPSKSSNLNHRRRRRQEWWAKKRQKMADKSNKEQREVKKKIVEHSGGQNENSSEGDTSHSRHILFIGNLSYDCSENDLRNHFDFSGGLKDVRVLTKKGTGKSKGCAFLEFESRAIQMKALKLHHSTLCGRKINVELTCGGGGKGEHRMKKLKSKFDRMKEKRRKAKLKKKRSSELGNNY